MEISLPCCLLCTIGNLLRLGDSKRVLVCTRQKRNSTFYYSCFEYHKRQETSNGSQDDFEISYNLLSLSAHLTAGLCNSVHILIAEQHMPRKNATPKFRTSGISGKLNSLSCICQTPSTENIPTINVKKNHL